MSATVSAVRTTGIYCRPSCSARPDHGNVVAYDLPAAAEAAGYRACLRCRPYRTGTVHTWDAPEVVCRAVRLVTAGMLDGATEDDLAARLHVSARHLRRLFTDHLGVTPDQLARSRRAHFARRLLDDTDLPVAEIAFASGFGSVRQLNRACNETFHAPPTALRARRRRHDRLVADGGLALRLPVDGPFDAAGMLAFLAPRAVPGVEAVGGGVYRRIIDVDGDPGVVEVDLTGEHDDHVRAVVHLPHWGGLIHLAERARRALGLDQPVIAANDALRDHATIGPLVRARPGLRVPGAWDGFEVAVRAVVGQQVSVSGATTLLGRIAARAGRPVPGLSAFGLDRAFPTAAEVATADLDGLGLTTARTRTLHALADAVATGEVALDGSVTYDELTSSLLALPGIGPWTAGYVAMRLGERDALPHGDLGLVRALEDLGHADGRAALAELQPSWSPWRATAAVHLWHHLTASCA